MNGVLSELSLAEIFQVLERRQDTGLLRLQVPPSLGLEPQFWICEGKLVAAVLRPGEQRLETLVHRHVSDRQAGERALEKVQQICPCDRPLGFWLKTMGFMQPDELQRIFHHQVVTSVIACLGLGEGRYEFVVGEKAPLVELSGFSMSAVTIALLGLRDLKDWSGIVRRLPRVDSALRLCPGQPRVWLTHQEWRLWEFANGLVSLEAIAAQMKLPLLEVQKLAFQMMVAGLVQEIPFAVLELAAEITLDWEAEPPSGSVEVGSGGMSLGEVSAGETSAGERTWLVAEAYGEGAGNPAGLPNSSRANWSAERPLFFPSDWSVSSFSFLRAPLVASPQAHLLHQLGGLLKIWGSD